MTQAPKTPKTIVHDAAFTLSIPFGAKLPAGALPEIAFAGRSNVGKSSLMNSLVARQKLVRTSSSPGCTRALNFFDIRTDQTTFTMVDLPGYGFAARSKKEKDEWAKLIERYLEKRELLKAVVVVVDLRHGLTEQDTQLIDYLKAIGRYVIGVATKADKLAKHERAPKLAAINRTFAGKTILYSAVDHTGREDVWRQLHRVLANPS